MKVFLLHYNDSGSPENEVLMVTRDLEKAKRHGQEHEDQLERDGEIDVAQDVVFKPEGSFSFVADGHHGEYRIDEWEVA